MRDEYQEIREVSWFEKIGSSCLGAILGVLLFLASFVLLVWNEGKLNVAAMAQSSVDISAIATPTAQQNQFVSITDKITTTTPLGDDRFLLPGPYVVVDRVVEMYAWDEERKTERQKHLGGSETEITRYTYQSRWTPNPENSSDFKYPQNHQNPPKAIPDQLFKVPTARVGRYTLDMPSFTRVSERRSSCQDPGSVAEWGYGGTIHLPPGGNLSLGAQNSRVDGKAQRTPNYIFQGTGTPQTPNIGDIRVCYGVLPTNTTVTVFGQLNQTQILPYIARQTPVYRVIPGTRAAAIAALKSEHTIWTWVFRAGGFLMMWFGLMLMGSPLSAFLDVIPWLGDVAEGITFISSFITAFVLSTVTILTAMLLQHPFALLLAISTTIAALLLLRRWRQRSV